MSEWLRYAVEVRVRGEADFVGNGIVYDTEVEAIRAAKDLAGRWTAVQDWRVVTKKEVPS